MDIPPRLNNQLEGLSTVPKHINELMYTEISALSPLSPKAVVPSILNAGTEGFNWVLSYSDEIYKHWRKLEQKRMIVKSYQNFANVRGMLISIMRNLHKAYGLTNTTLHLGVYILDNFWSRNSPNYIEMRLMVITAILVAAKVEDVEARVPRFAELNQRMLNDRFSLMDYRRLEAKMLICLDFNLTVPTVATFANYFSRITVVLEDFHIHRQFFEKNSFKHCEVFSSIPYERIMYVLFERYDEMLSAVNELLHRLIDYTLECTTLNNILPSQKAAGCIAAARWLYNVQPVWTPFLEMQICYTESEIRPIMEAIICIYDVHVSNDSSSEDSAQMNSYDGDDDDDVDDDNKETSSSCSSSKYSEIDV